MKVSEKIKKFRHLKGLSQQEVADKLRMSKNGYGSIERGEAGSNYLRRLQRLAEILEVDISDFFDRTEQNIFNLAGTQNNQSNWHVTTSSSVEEITQIKQELEKSRFLLEQQTKEIELLRQQNADLRTMIEFLQKDKKM